MLCSVLPPFKLKAKLSNYDMPGFLSFCEVHGGIFADLPGEVLEKNHFCQWPHQSHFVKMIFWRKHPAHWQHHCHQDLFQILFQIFHSLFHLDQWFKSQESQTDFLSSTLCQQVLFYHHFSTQDIPPQCWYACMAPLSSLQPVGVSTIQHRPVSRAAYIYTS